jgi:hypothetical protein
LQNPVRLTRRMDLFNILPLFLPKSEFILSDL